MTGKSFIVGDIGGSKSDWRVVSAGEILQVEGAGFNAYTHDLNTFRKELEVSFEKIDLTGKVPAFLYAAGVDTAGQREEVTQELNGVFGDNLEVENDLLGAARSLCGKDSGNVCIVGTGSNACYYDGTTVSKVSASLGYVLGDEGSGAYLGKKLLAAVFRGQLSKTITDAFQEQFALTSHDAIKRIYEEPMPNHFLASFAPFVFQHRNEPAVYQLVYEAFIDFQKAFFFGNLHENEAYYFSGSIAHYFSDILRQVAKDQGFEIKKIVEKPIAGLVHYHQEYE